MAKKKLGASIATFAHNLRTHVKRVVLGRESMGEAFADVAHDARKLGQAAEGGSNADGRKRAHKLTKKGREVYNKKDYERAEQYFRKAVQSDGLYGFAHLYLGNTLYRLKREEEAVQEWKKTMTADPGSDAAIKAESKLRRVDEKFQEVVDHLGQQD